MIREVAPLEVGSERQLFIDERFIAESKGVELVLEKPDLQRERLFTADRPWEAGRAGTWSSLVHEGERFHFWYDAYGWDAQAHRHRTDSHCYCYAVSDDGLTFTKPELNLFEVGGIKENNVVMRAVEGGPVFLDPFAPEERRFRALTRWHPIRGSGWSELQGATPNQVWVFSSPDGIRWRRGSRPLLERWLGATQSVVWDDRHEKWVLYLRAHRHRAEGGSRRCHARLELDRDALDGEVILEGGADSAGEQVPLTDELPIVLDVDDEDPPGAQMYVSNVIKYDRAADVYLAFIPMWYDARGGAPASDRLEVQLAFSRDGIQWRRPWREPVIAPGITGSVSAGQVFPVQNPVIVGAEIWLYYHGLPDLHMSPTVQRGADQLARAIWTVDRFVAVTLDHPGGGELVTPPLYLAGSRLTVNVNTGAAGNLQVGVETADGTALPGHGIDDAVPVRGNDVAAPVRWRSGDEIRGLAKAPVCLRFRLARGRLYGFRAAGEDPV